VLRLHSEIEVVENLEITFYVKTLMAKFLETVLKFLKKDNSNSNSTNNNNNNIVSGLQCCKRILPCN
jgi:hypothetical protein